MPETYSIKLPVFEGPLDLLLHLIRENEIDIYDIPISLITRQYLEYVGLMKELNLDIAGEFLVMAATLIYIKSRMLLPQEEAEAEGEAEDPRVELVQRLLEYKAFKEVSLALREKEEEWAEVFSREPVEETEEEEKEELYLFDLNVFDLIGAFKKILESAPPETTVITRDALSVKDKMSYIVEVMEGREAVRFEELFKAGIAKPHIIVTFVALLELLRLGILRAYQDGDFGPIWLLRPEGADAGGIRMQDGGLDFPPTDARPDLTER